MSKLYISVIIMLLYCSNNMTAQTSNAGELKVMPSTDFSTVAKFNNTTTGDVINDGTLYIYADLNNDGLMFFSPSLKSGSVYFRGTSGNQEISGTIPIDFNNVKFENDSAQPAFLLSGDINIAGISDFKKGIIDADNNGGTIVFKENATHNNASNKSFVDGEVSKIGNAAFEFPIGDDKYYRPSLNAISNLKSDSYASHYFFKNSDASYPHSNKQKEIKLINNKEYWIVSKEKGDTNIVLSLTLNRETTPNEMYSGADDGTSTQIVRWDNALNQWIPQGGVVDNDQTMVTAQVSGYGIFTTARVTAVLEEKDLVVYNAVSPNGDGVNDFFLIEGIAKYPENSIQIYNRWGILVYEADGYNETDKVFTGLSEGRSTVKKGSGLPTGTYFYILKYKTQASSKQKSGYLYINQNN